MSETHQNDVPAIRLENITKSFGSVIANNNVSLSVNHGEIMAILGENGSGKTTLMNMISGIYFPDRGRIFADGKEVVIRSPKYAFRYGIGMIHQHFKLVDVFTAAENITLGMKEKGRYDIRRCEEQIGKIAAQYGFEIDPRRRICDMSVSEKQTVEIIKVLYRGADILILDEPTAVLTPQETEKLFTVLRRMREDNKAIIIITHKLNEVMAISDRVTVLCKGENAGVVKTSETTEEKLTEMMVGKKISLDIERSEPKDVTPRLVVKGLSFRRRDGVDVLKDVTFTANAGEILGIAGIAGSGQRELIESIAGLLKPQGTISYIDPQSGKEEQLCGKTPIQIRRLGVRMAFVPEDRMGMGMVGSMGITDNVMLRSYEKGKTVFLDRKTPQSLSEDLIRELQIVTPDTDTPVSMLSGGNAQKVLVGREIVSEPKVLMAAYPVRGLDINASYTTYRLLDREKQKGSAVIFVGEDLDALLALSDRIMVMNSGCVTGIVDARKATKEEIGMLMTKSTKGEVDTVNGTN